MSIMSVSLPDSLVQQMDGLTKERGFAGRSDFVRAAIRDFVQQLMLDQTKRGKHSATITLLQAPAFPAPPVAGDMKDAGASPAADQDTKDAQPPTTPR